MYNHSENPENAESDPAAASELQKKNIKYKRRPIFDPGPELGDMRWREPEMGPCGRI